MSILAGAVAGGLGDLLSGAVNSLYSWEQNNWKSNYDVTKELRDYDKSVSDYFLDKQLAYNKEMSSTAYQRAIADMQAAGINPASMAGVNAQAASTPAASASYHTGSGYSPVAHNYMNNFLMGSMVNSAVNAMIAKDRNAASTLAAELVDNARHEHRLEEMREQYAYNVARDSNKFKNRNSLDDAKADYYDEMAKRLRWDRLGIKD